MDMFLLDLGLFFYRYQYFHDYLRQDISDSSVAAYSWILPWIKMYLKGKKKTEKNEKRVY